MALTIPAALTLRVRSNELTLATFDLPLTAEATTDPGVMTMVLDVPEFRALLAAALREAATEVEKIPDADFRAPEEV